MSWPVKLLVAAAVFGACIVAGLGWQWNALLTGIFLGVLLMDEAKKKGVRR